MERLVNKIDSTDLIIEVKKHRAIYDSNIPCDRKAKEQAWTNILATLIQDFEGKSPDQKSQLGRLLHRKWKSIRDSFIRAITSRKKYKFEEHLLFLKEALDLNADTDSETPSKRVKRGTAPSEDKDRLFMLSMVDELKKVPESKKLGVKIAIASLLAREQQCTSQSNYAPVQVTVPVTLQYGSGSIQQTVPPKWKH